MQLPVLKLTPLFLLVFTLISCDTEDPFHYDPDYSSVPEPYNYVEAEPVEVEEGVDAYILDEGEGFATANLRDYVSIHLTVRTLDKEIVYSSSADNNQNPVSFGVSEVQRRQFVQLFSPSAPYLPAFTTGLKAGLIGMQEGERRTLIVSPEKGYQGVDESSYTYQFRNDTLQYDIVLSKITYD